MASSSPETSLAGGGRLAANPRSVKARVKPTAVSGLLNLLKIYGTDVENSNVQVCEGRKCCHALQTGKITHPACFINEAPTPSRKNVRGQPPHVVNLKSTVIPDGWKVACVVEGRAWIAETKIIDDEMRYRFSLVREDGAPDDENVSPWAPNPSGAFKALFHKLCPDKKLESHNGKLYIGCHYERPQISLQNHFRTQGIEPHVLEAFPELRDLLNLWLGNQDLPIERKRQKRMGLGNGEQDSSSLGSSMSPSMSIAPSLTDASSVTSGESSPAPEMFDFDFSAFLNQESTSLTWDDEILDLIINEDEISDGAKRVTRDQAGNGDFKVKLQNRIGKPEKAIAYNANIFCRTFTGKLQGELKNTLFNASSMIQSLKALIQSHLPEDAPFSKYLLPRSHVESTERIIELVYDLQIRTNDMEADEEYETIEMACTMVDFVTALAMIRVRLAERLLAKAKISHDSNPIVHYQEFIEDILESSAKQHPYFTKYSQKKEENDKVLDAYINETFNEDELDDFFPPFHTLIPPGFVREIKAKQGFSKLWFFVTASPLVYLFRQ